MLAFSFAVDPTGQKSGKQPVAMRLAACAHLKLTKVFSNGLFIH
jgi:hypothetical protein